MGYLSIVIRKKADCMDTDEVEGVDVLFGSFLFSHHGEWEMFFFPIWSGIYLMREYFEILKIS